MAGNIGIKIANGQFYSLTEENVPANKKLILTTVHDRQASVQIDLFRSVSKTMLDAQYIGSMVVENIRPKLKGEPSIEMVISSDSDGNITADAYDLDAAAGGEHHTLNVSLKTLDSPVWGSDDFPDFDFETTTPPPTGLYEQENRTDGEEKKFPWLIMGLATLFVALAIAVLWFFFFGGRETVLSRSARRPPVETTVPLLPPPVLTQPATPPPPFVEPEPEPLPPVVVPRPEPVQPVAPPPVAPAKPADPPPVIRAPTTPPPAPQTVRRQRPPAPVSSYRVPAVIPRNGVVYQIQWGDTLWDISAAFYRDPWLYPRIAKYNNIKNPDRIISGFNVRIPPKE